MKPTAAFRVALVLSLATSQLFTDSPDAMGASPQKPPGDLAVREVTVFKDGHAFVVCGGSAATDSAGNVVLAELPRPILGTFWPFAADPNAKLRGVVVGQRDVEVARTAQSVRELILANVGARVIITESGRSYSAKILDVPRPTKGEATAAPAAAAKLVVLETADGVRVVDLSRVQDVTFKDANTYHLSYREQQRRNRMTLRLDWGGKAPHAGVEVGMMYVQKGLRWIPNYKVVLDGKGRAKVALEGTLINELRDLEGVTVNLVIGVPKFEFEHTLDPMALQQAAAQLSPYFQAASQTAYALSNAIMAQTARMQEVRQPGAPVGVDVGADVPGVVGDKNEDLYVFTIQNVTLAAGERMVVPVAEFELPYTDIYKLDVPMTPPASVWRQFGEQRKAQLAALFHAPKVQHYVRLTNGSRCPLTTAPALLMRGDRVLAQSMMTYTAVGAQTDLALTTAVDVRVEKTDHEVGREPKAKIWRGDDYTRIALESRLELKNFGGETIAVEITRHVLGNVDEVKDGGVATRLNLVEAPAHTYIGGGSGNDSGPYGYPFWWGWYSWPWWWHHFNGIGRIEWKVQLEPGQDLQLDYSWHYYWR